MCHREETRLWKTTKPAYEKWQNEQKIWKGRKTSFRMKSINWRKTSLNSRLELTALNFLNRSFRIRREAFSGIWLGISQKTIILIFYLLVSFVVSHWLLWVTALIVNCTWKEMRLFFLHKIRNMEKVIFHAVTLLLCGNLTSLWTQSFASGIWVPWSPQHNQYMEDCGPCRPCVIPKSQKN